MTTPTDPGSSQEPGTTLFDMSVEQAGARTIVTLKGELDNYTAVRLREGFALLADLGGRHVVVDLAGVRFIDSSGLSALVTSLRHVRDEGGLVSLRSMTRQLLKLFEITGLTKLFPIE